MLRAEDNNFLTESGPGTPMGELLRRFWLPVLLAEELPEADGPPKKIVVMGEDYWPSATRAASSASSINIVRTAALIFGSAAMRNAASAASITAGNSIPTAAASICRRRIPISTPKT
jgi:hypothetical protein